MQEVTQMQHAAIMAQQAEVYRSLLAVCLRVLNCKNFEAWGYTDRSAKRFQRLMLKRFEKLLRRLMSLQEKEYYILYHNHMK